MKKRKKPQGGPPGDRVRGLFHDIYKNRMTCLSISPFFLIHAIFWIFPTFYPLSLSSHKQGGVGGKKFAGLFYFQHLLQDNIFLLSIKNTLVIWVLSIISMIILAAVLVFLLNDASLEGKNFLRAVCCLPDITSAAAIAIVFANIFSNKHGILNFLINRLGFDPVQWTSLTWDVHVAIVAIVMWRWTGYNVITLLVGLQKIPSSLYEAASLDRASIFQILRRTAVPPLNPMIQFVMITFTIGGWQLFTEAQVLMGTAGEIDKSDMTVVLYLYDQALSNHQLGYGSTISWALVVVIGFCSLINWMITRWEVDQHENE